MQKKLIAAFVLQLMVSALWAQQTVTDSISLRGELEEIIVSSIRLGNNSSITTGTFTSHELQQQNTGVNLPYLLTTTPSLVVTSDDGLGIGYTYFRIRGTDQNRINMTVNGVPLNDAESQRFFG